MTEFEDISLEEMISDGFDIVAQEINIDDLAETEKNSEQKIFPILPVRNMVMFPNVVIPITAGRKASINCWKKRRKMAISSES
jgi:ATP-dependent Lon protease